MALGADYRYAGFWWRFLAYVIDASILTIAGTVVGAALGLVLDAAGFSFEAIRAIVSFCVMVLWWLYFALSESSAWRATFGKRILGMLVVDANGQQISFGRATARYFAKILSVLILGFGFFMIGWTRRKQGLHDMIAGCIVVRRIGILEEKTTRW